MIEASICDKGAIVQFQHCQMFRCARRESQLSDAFVGDQFTVRQTLREESHRFEKLVSSRFERYFPCSTSTVSNSRLHSRSRQLFAPRCCIFQTIPDRRITLKNNKRFGFCFGFQSNEFFSLDSATSNGNGWNKRKHATTIFKKHETLLEKVAASTRRGSSRFYLNSLTSFSNLGQPMAR